MHALKKMALTLANPHCRATAIRVALVVGSLLFAINHGGALMHHEMNRNRWLSGLLTYFVPFLVSIHGQSVD